MFVRSTFVLTSLSLMASAALAADTPFTPDAAQTWSARSLRIAAIVTDARNRGESIAPAEFRSACTGLTGEQMNHEYGKEPRWALSSQLWFCNAYDGWAKRFGGNKSPCGAMKKGLGELDKMGDAPAEVVAAATTLRAAAAMLLKSAKQFRAC